MQVTCFVFLLIMEDAFFREVIEKKCKFVTVGYVQREQCDEWPVQKCDKTT